MQFLPLEASAQSTASLFARDGASVQSGAEGGFDAVLSSFIEEGRTDYSGRPAGFSAYATDGGTISGETAESFAKSLRARNVAESCVSLLEDYAASGSPLTVATAFRLISGKGRGTPALEGDEREAFKGLLGKLGFSKEEQEELIGLSDDGKSQELLKRLSKAMEENGDALAFTMGDWNILLKGLDMGGASRKNLLSAFGSDGEGTLDGLKISSLLAGVNGELATRASAAQYAATQMRDAMNEALRAKKNSENNGQVENARGNRRSEQSEELMQSSVRKHTGVDEVKRDGADANGEDADGRREDKTRSERILSLNPEAEAAKKSDKGKDSGSASKLTQRIELAASFTAGAPQPAPQSQAPTLDALAARNRQEIFSQVESGLLQSMRGGSQRLTLQLNPAELGQVTVILSVHQNEVRASIRAEKAESAEVLSQQLTELKANLEAQGLKVMELDVQTNLSDNAFAGNWDGTQEHNLMRDSSERDRLIRLARLRRDSVQDSDSFFEQAPPSAPQAGLHVVA